MSFLCGRSSRRTLQVDHEDKGWLEKSECTWLSSCLAVYCPQRSCYLQHRKPESLTQAESSKAQKHTTCCICSERDDECLHGLCWLTWCFNHLQDCLLTPCPFESFLYSHSLLPPSFWWACLFVPPLTLQVSVLGKLHHQKHCKDGRLKKKKNHAKHGKMEFG